MTIGEKILKLAKALYPTGRAFKMFPGSELEKLHQSLADGETQAYKDAVSILDSILPDNDNFTEDDAAIAEHRYGLITNPLVSLADRKKAIIRKMNHPGTVPARENWRFLQSQLQAAGFNVWVYENRFPDGMGGYETQTPQQFTGDSFPAPQYGQLQYGNTQYGRGTYNFVVNYIDELIDRRFNIGTNLRSTFFIGGPYPGEYATVDVNRKEEFRQMILRIKPVQTVGFLLINYI